MTQSILAKYDGSVIMPDQPLELRPGQRLRVEIQTIDAETSRFAELLDLETDLPDAPADLASQHDHYLYGTPKR